MMSPDFTEERYAELLDLAATRFAFRTFAEVPQPQSAKPDERVALWRHDIDFSPNRALQLARMEASRQLKAIYFLQLTARFYSVFETETRAMLQEIAGLGHQIGLHYDPDAYGGKEFSARDALLFEVDTLSRCLGIQVDVFTLHNPTTYDANAFSAPECAGLCNASAPEWRKHFTYCSDSNGVWRFTPLAELLADPQVSNIYALTHPEWWQPEAMLPRERIERCISGRARAAGFYYDNLLADNNRPNIGHEET